MGERLNGAFDTLPADVRVESLVVRGQPAAVLVDIASGPETRQSEFPRCDNGLEATCLLLAKSDGDAVSQFPPDCCFAAADQRVPDLVRVRGSVHLRARGTHHAAAVAPRTG
jgi:hypothetical protein